MKFQWNNNIANELNPLRNNSRRKELQTWLLCWLKLQRSHQETREARFNRRATAGIEEGIEAADVQLMSASQELFFFIDGDGRGLCFYQFP